MKIYDERTDGPLIEWHEIIKGEIYEFNIPSYSNHPFIGMALNDASSNLETKYDRWFVVDLETGESPIFYDTTPINYIKKLKTELVIKK